MCSKYIYILIAIFDKLEKEMANQKIKQKLLIKKIIFSLFGKS